MTLAFSKRPIKRHRLDWEAREWLSTPLGYRISLSLIPGLPKLYLACAYEDDWANWRIISRHRTLSAAQKACEKHARGIQ